MVWMAHRNRCFTYNSMSGFSSSQTVSHNQRVSYLLTWAVEICRKKSVVHPHGHMGTWPQDQVPDPQAPGSRFWGLQRSFRNGDPFFRIRNSRNGHFSVRIWKRFSTFLGFSNFFERQSVSKIYRSSHVFPPGPVGISERKGKPQTLVLTNLPQIWPGKTLVVSHVAKIVFNRNSTRFNGFSQTSSWTWTILNHSRVLDVLWTFELKWLVQICISCYFAQT